MRPARAGAGGAGGQEGQREPGGGGAAGAGLCRRARRAVRVPGQWRGGAVPRSGPRRAFPPGGHRVRAGGSGAADRDAHAAGAADQHRRGRQGRGPRLPAGLHRGAVPGDGAGPAQAAGRDGDRHRQDADGGRPDQAAVRRQLDHPGPVPGRPQHAGQADRGRVRRASADAVDLPRAAHRRALHGAQADHDLHPADHDQRVPPLLGRLLRSGRHRRVPPQHLRRVPEGARPFRRRARSGSPRRRWSARRPRTGTRRTRRRSATRSSSSRSTRRPSATR